MEGNLYVKLNFNFFVVSVACLLKPKLKETAQDSQPGTNEAKKAKMQNGVR